MIGPCRREFLVSISIFSTYSSYLGFLFMRQLGDENTDHLVVSGCRSLLTPAKPVDLNWKTGNFNPLPPDLGSGTDTHSAKALALLHSFFCEAIAGDRPVFIMFVVFQKYFILYFECVLLECSFLIFMFYCSVPRYRFVISVRVLSGSILYCN